MHGEQNNTLTRTLCVDGPVINALRFNGFRNVSNVTVALEGPLKLNQPTVGPTTYRVGQKSDTSRTM